jgi:hypothetical protein
MEKRKHPRYAAYGGVQIGAGQGYFLKDISTAGCCIKYPADSDGLSLAREYHITVHPEPEAQAGDFDLTVEPCWIQDAGDFREAGCFISAFPEGKHYRYFANYLAWRTSQE